MLPIVVLTSAWAENVGMSHPEIASLLLDFNPANAIQAGEGDVCPQCRRHPVEEIGEIFIPESSTPERVKGRAFVLCLCKTVYWYVAADKVDVHQPIGEASVRAASASQPVASPPPPGPAVVTNFRESHRFPFVHAAADVAVTPGTGELRLV